MRLGKREAVIVVEGDHKEAAAGIRDESKKKEVSKRASEQRKRKDNVLDKGKEQKKVAENRAGRNGANKHGLLHKLCCYSASVEMEVPLIFGRTVVADIVIVEEEVVVVVGLTDATIDRFPFPATWTVHPLYYRAPDVAAYLARYYLLSLSSSSPQASERPRCCCCCQ